MKYWARKDAIGKITTVESYSHDLPILGAEEITEAEYKNFLASLPEPIIEPVRDLATELDDLKIRVEKLEKK